MDNWPPRRLRRSPATKELTEDVAEILETDIQYKITEVDELD